VQFTDKPLVIHWAEGMQMLRDAGHEVRLRCLRSGVLGAHVSSNAIRVTSTSYDVHS
jgi:hypothetical protein